MSQRTETEVLVVGAGPVGLFTALALTSRGVKVQVVDEEFRTAAHSYALAVHPRSLELLDEFGLASEVLAQGYHVDTVAFYEGADRCGELKLSALGGKFPVVVVLPQSALEGLLEQSLKKKGVKVLWNHRVRRLEPNGPLTTAEIDKQARGSCGYAVATTEWVTEKTLRTASAFVVGADGHRSVVRKTLHINYAPAGPTESFAVFEFHSDADLAGEVRVVFDGETTNVVWPLPGGRCRWGFQRTEGDASEATRTKRRLTVPIGRQAFPHVPTDALNELLKARAPWFEARVKNVEWSMEIRFDRRLAASFGRERSWLAGDAAHLTGPVGGQSLNMGIREASDLSWRLTRILRDAAPLASLNEYNEVYVGAWRQLLAVDGGLSASDSAEGWARKHRAQILPCIPATGDELTQLASQIGLGFASAE
ncbi:MAG: NAD(P)/FAD-dependent oxidoreductase [Phycisphaerae bacterium]|jgi:2-polyprenyl-6-methoxyphenol hydroxylase-like FAD-dependent oxidoreductase